MVVLPRDGQSLDDARVEMLSEIDDLLTTVLLARGDDQRTRDFVNRAENVALRAPGRRVIHLRDPAVLTQAQETNWFADDGEDAVIGTVLNNQNGRCGKVLRKRPSRVSIDREGFLQCEKVAGLA